MNIVLRIAVYFFLLLSSVAFSQETTMPEPVEPIAADRPDQTETPFIVPKGMFQMENGFSYEKTNDEESTIVSPTILFKYGVNENVEIRLITEYSTTTIGDEKISGFHPILVGTKIKVCEEKGIIPKTSFIGHLLIPNLASAELKAEYYAAEFRFTMQHTISDKISLSYNFGAEWDGMVPDATFVYTLTGGFSITDKFGSYIEFYGFAPQNDKASHNFDGGFTYLISNDFMIDTSAGFGITDNAPEYFISVGFSFRI
jgi:hypothetical protein